MSEESMLLGGGILMAENGEVKGSLYRTEVIAQLFGVSVRRVQQLTQEGIISTTKILEDGHTVRSTCLKRRMGKLGGRKRKWSCESRR